MKYIYWPLILPVLVILGASLLILSSISSKFLIYQSVWIGLGALIFLFFYFFDWRPFVAYPWFVGFIYLVIIALLILTYLFAPSIRGNRAWLVLGPLQFQTSEFAKAALIFVYAYFLGKHHLSIARAKTIFYSFALLIVPLVLVLREPDLGSAVVIGALWFFLILLAGLRPKHLLAAIFVFAVASFLAWSFFLAGYQKDRVMGLFNPDRDPLGINYNVIQSKIAIGSAGFWGRGYHQGTQTQLGFLPEASTDFIFPAFIEEWGIAGGLLIIFSFLYLTFGILRIGALAETNFERFICLGSAVIFGLHFAINVGSAVGFFPVVGVPFPFLSYGGSNLVTNSLLFAVVHSIARRHA